MEKGVPPRKIAIYLTVAVLVFGVFRTHLSARRSATPEECGMAIRVSAFAWRTVFLFLLAFVFPPNKRRVILLVPGFIFAVCVAKSRS